MRELLGIFLVLGTAIVGVRAQGQGTVVFADERYVVSYRVTDQEVRFTMDDLRAREAGRATADKMPASSFNIYIDVNGNGKVDRYVDRTYGTYRNHVGLCSQLMVDETSFTPCGGFETNAYFEKSSRSTESAPFRHMVTTYVIPRREIAKDGQTEIHVLFQCSTEGDAFWGPNAFYPRQNIGGHSLEKTFELKL